MECGKLSAKGFEAKQKTVKENYSPTAAMVAGHLGQLTILYSARIPVFLFNISPTNRNLPDYLYLASPHNHL